jgi:hypothetical protein
MEKIIALFFSLKAMFVMLPWAFKLAVGFFPFGT